jgi:hypothetical protein
MRYESLTFAMFLNCYLAIYLKDGQNMQKLDCSAAEPVPNVAQKV